LTGQENNGQGHQQGEIPRTDVTSFLKSCRTVARIRNIHSIHLGIEHIIRNMTTNPEGTTLRRTGQCHIQADVLGHAVKHLAEARENVTSIA